MKIQPHPMIYGGVSFTSHKISLIHKTSRESVQIPYGIVSKCVESSVYWPDSLKTSTLWRRCWFFVLFGFFMPPSKLRWMTYDSCRFCHLQSNVAYYFVRCNKPPRFITNKTRSRVFWDEVFSGIQANDAKKKMGAHTRQRLRPSSKPSAVSQSLRWFWTTKFPTLHELNLDHIYGM